jgi:hypothetical protein
MIAAEGFGAPVLVVVILAAIAVGLLLRFTGSKWSRRP